MQDNGRREQLRQIYQREDTGEKTFIPAKPRINPNERDRFFRVCAYCRVSTDNDEQLSSFELQQAHYRQLVQPVKPAFPCDGEHLREVEADRDGLFIKSE